MTGIEDLAARAKEKPRRPVLAVVCPYDAHTLKAAARASREGIAEVALYGGADIINAALASLGVPGGGFDIVDLPSPAEALAAAVGSARRGGAGIIMKGLVGTSDFLRAVLSRGDGLRQEGGGGLLSAFGLFETPRYHKLFAVSDFAMNVAPDLPEKRAILENAAGFLRALGVDTPKIAVLSEAERVNPKSQASVDALELKRVNETGGIADCVVEGPIAFDLAMSREAAEIKGYASPVAGEADLLVVPDVVTGNALVKSLTIFGGARTAGVLLGARVPVVLTSRSAETDDKYYSIALAALGAK
ncbi:MAG: phosphate butyryltransferase Ptb [Oscillospiraceae bacterium]|nr:phosphate butyryltransferase Ptb [Oscillospiraceae bacterium]